MTVFELMSRLGAAGIKLWVEDGQLKFKAPKGALTGELKDALVARKQEVIDFLSSTRISTDTDDRLPVADRSQPLHLSHAQNRLWFIEQLTPGNSTFHIPAPLLLTGILDTPALESAFLQLLQRHEALRTVFHTVDGEPRQRVQPVERFSVPLEDLTHLPAPEREAAARQRIERDIRTPFDLENGPLVRARLFRLDDHRHALIVVMHHIVTDGWSMAIFVREIAALYAAARMGMQAPLPPLDIQYGDFAEWQRGWLQGERLERQLDYWRQQLAGAPVELGLPFDRPRPPMQTANGAVLDLYLDATLTARLKTVARQFETTPYVVLLAVYKILLARWARQTDLCVGMPVAGRTRPEVEGLIGFFVNTLVIRTHQDGKPSFAAFVAQVKEQVLGAQSHQDVPFEAIVEDLNIPRNLSFAPVYQVAFSLTSSEGAARKAVLGGLEIEPLPVELVAARLDLTLMLADYGDHIAGVFEYNTDLFDPATLARFGQHFTRLLDRLTQDVNGCIDTVPLLDEAELRHALGLGEEAEAVLPLTPMQRDFCFDSLREPETARNSIGDAIAVPGPVNQDRLKQMLQVVTAAHPLLRVRIVEGTQPWMEPLYQVVMRDAPIALEVQDWRQHAYSEAELQQRLEQLVLQPWDVLEGPLVRHYLVLAQDDRTIYVSSAHHAIFDGVSKRNLVRDVLDAYQGNPIHPDSIADLARWVRERGEQTDTAAVLDYWRDALAQSEPLGTRAAQPGPAQVQHWQLHAAEVESLQRWCDAQRISPANYLRTLYGLALQRCHYHDNRIVLIDAIAGRTPALENAVGCFFQFVPSVQQSGADITHFTQLLAANRQWRKQMGDACYLSMLARRRFLNPNALEFQFNYRLPQVGHAINCQGQQLHILPVQPDNPGTVKLLVTPRDGALDLRFSYRENDFPGFALLQRMQQVHRQIQAGEDRLAALDWLLAEERQQQFFQWQGVDSDAGQGETLLDLIARQVDASPEATAVICGPQRQTYREFDAASNRVAHWLNRQGIGAGARVALCLDRSLWLPALYLGVVKSGAAYVPMDAGYPPERIAWIVQDSGAQVLVTQQCVLDHLRDAGIELPSGIHLLLADDIDTRLQTGSDQPPSRSPGPDDVLYYVFTSGSTGRPKGAGVYHRGERNLLEWYRHLLALGGQDRVLLISALGFDLTQKNLFVPFCAGAALVLPDFEEYDPEKLADLLARERISVVNGAPSAFYPLVEQTGHPGYPFSHLRHLVLGGEPIRLGTLQPWLNDPRVQCQLTNSYGPTECTDVVAACSLHRIDDPAAGMPIGRPLPNTRLHIVNSQGQPMPTGATGELCVAGIGVGTGYLNRDELNAQSFQPDPFGNGRSYRTGDLVRYDASGSLIYVGRKDFQVKLRGLRIEPGEIDSLLKTLPTVRDALTLVLDERLVSYLIAPRSLDTAATRDTLKKHLPDFMVPAALVLLDIWPLTPNGKIDRKALPAPGTLAQGPFVAPRNDSEQRIADIWCQVLKLPRVSVTANFFEVGGHSLLATQVVSRIRQAFGVELSVRTLFESPSIEKLTRAIGSAAAAGLIDTAPPIRPLDPPNRDTLSFAQYRLWFVDQLNQGSSEYNLPSALKIDGPLDLAVLDRVFGEIVRRHEVLRTRFGEQDGVPQLIVCDAGPWQSPLTDLSALAADAQAQAVAQQVDQDANRTFDLARDTLFTTRLLKLSAQQHILLLNMHHIISDGWSLGVLVQEIQALYLAFAAGRASPLPELPIQYSDFSVWQRQWLQADTLDRLRDYWKQTLSGAPDVLRMPTDKPRPKIQTFNGAHHPVSLGPVLADKVKRFCDRHDLTPFMVLMGAYHLLLSRYSGQQDICVGIPIAGRNRAEIEGLIGFFVNGLVIRSRLDGNPSVEQYFRQIKQTALGAYAHQDMPADLLLDALKMERSADTSPGAQVGFALQNVAETEVQASMAGLHISAVPREHKTAKYELSLILQESAGDISGVMEYNTDLFLEDTIGRLLRHYTHLLEQMLDQPDQLLDRLLVVAPDELYGLLHQDPATCELLPLSPMQRDMYLDALLEPDSLKNSLGYHFITDGPFDLTLWRQATQYLLDTQPLLRARLLRSHLPYTDVACLRVDRHRTASVIFEDWSDRITTDEAAAAFAQRTIWQPYDIHGELSGYGVYKLNGNRHLVVFRMNHILLDGAGMAVHLLNSIAAAQAIRAGQPCLPAPVIYPEYVHDNTRRTDTTEVIAHWRELSRSVEALDFPLPPQARAAAASRTRIEKQLRLDDAHWTAVQQYCEQQRITPSLYFKALYGLLINTYCRGEADFVVSEVVGGRTGPHKRAFGNYFQVLPVVFPQSLFAPGHQVDELFAYIRNYRKSLRGNASVSLLTQRRTLPQGRLHFMFNYYNFIPSVELFGTRVKLKAYPQVQDGPVQFVVHEQDGWMELNLIYLSDLFADLDFLRRIERLSQQILSGITAVDALERVLPQEKPQQLQHWNDTAQSLPPHVSLVTWFDQQVQKTPHNIAVKQGSEQLTYVQLQQQANRLANGLLQSGVQKGQKVGICLDRSPLMLVAVLGALKAGAAYVPMDSQYPSERLAYMLDDAKAPVLLTQKCIVDRLRDCGVNLHGTQVVELDQQPNLLEAPATAPDVVISGDDPIYVIYTSGSTGKPKGAMVKHAGEVNLQHWYLNALNITDRDRFLLISAFGFDLTQKNLFAPLLVGGTLVIPPGDAYDVDVIADTLHREAISLVNGAPSAFYPVVENASRSGYPFPALRYLVLGGEPIRMNALQGWLEHPSCQCRLVNSYGPTECTDVVSYHINPDPRATLLPIGRPVCNTQLYIVGAGNQLLPEGVVGELCVAGNGVGLGYLDRPELTAAAFQPNPYGPGRWYRTGDLARYWPDGNIEYLGRKDFQIKLRGLRIELGEIEHALRQQDGVSDSLTLVKDDQLVSYLIAPKGFDGQACKTTLRNALPDYMVPSHLLVLERWPLTPNGKVDRNALPSPTDTGRAPYVAPRDETEEKLAAIWSEVLGVDKVGVHDSFFDLGGHSLLAARAVSKFRHAFNVDIPLRALFELHTIADIARYLETLQWAAQAAETAQQTGSSEGRDEGFL